MPLGPDNLYGVGFVSEETDFQTEQEAIRSVDPAASRIWKIKNNNVRNRVTGGLLKHSFNWMHT